VDEIKALLAEGIELHELVAPEKLVVKDNRVQSIVCAKMKLIKSESDSRFSPVKIKDEFTEFQADTIIPALGQEIDIDFISPAELRSEKGSYETQIPGVFIGGDAMRGAATIVKAVGDGRKAAIQIAAKAGIVLPSEKLSSDKKMTYSDFMVYKSKRERIDLSITGDHPEFTAESAIRESSRCLQCGDVCSVCITVCPNRANKYYLADATEVPVWKVNFLKDETIVEIDSYLKILQKYQVFNVADFCNECGNCTTFCPTKGQPFSDKPRFCLTPKSFNQTENGFFLSENGRTRTLLHRTGSKIMSLSKAEDHYIFSDPNAMVNFDLTDFKVLDFKNLNGSASEIILSKASEMKVLIDSIHGIL
jgi:putative selenate reductase